MGIDASAGTFTRITERPSTPPGFRSSRLSQTNVELVRKHSDAYNAFMRDELSRDAYLELFDPEIELHWRDRQTYPDTPQHLRGAQELIAFTEQYRQGWT